MSDQIVSPNILSRLITRQIVASHSLHRSARFIMVLPAFFLPIMLCLTFWPNLSFAGSPCILNYSEDTNLEWNGAIQGTNRSRNPKAVSMYVRDCVGITIKKGKITVEWREENGFYPRKTFNAPTTLTESIFKNAQSSPFLERFDEKRTSISEALCGQCSEKRPGGSRGAGDNIAQVLHDALSGVLVVGPDGLKWPLRKSDFQDIATFKIFTGDITHREVVGVTRDTGMIRIAPRTLVAEQSYVWEAGIQEAGKLQLYSGRFEVADEARTKTTLARLAEIRNAANGQMTFDQEAAFYFERGLLGNATIALIQWFNANNQDK